MFSSNDKKSHNLKDNVRNLSSMISMIEETLLIEEQKYEELSQMKQKLALLEKSKEEALMQVEEERAKLDKLYKYEQSKIAEVVREKEIQKTREIEELKNKFERENQQVLDNKANELAKSYEAREKDLQTKLDKDKADFQNKIKSYLENLNKQIYTKVDTAQSAITSINSEFKGYLDDVLGNIDSAGSGYANVSYTQNLDVVDVAESFEEDTFTTDFNFDLELMSEPTPVEVEEPSTLTELDLGIDLDFNLDLEIAATTDEDSLTYNEGNEYYEEQDDQFTKNLENEARELLARLANLRQERENLLSGL